IAAITSCTNTSNPQVMIGAGLLAKHAVERGMKRKPWVKSSLAPGSKVVTEYYEQAGLTRYLDELGFQTVGYGCTTCIGNSGPLPEPISEAIAEGDLVVCSVLSGNRNFEARIHPEVKANYLASPPLVVAYALAGRMDIDLGAEPLDGDVYLHDIWPSAEEIADTIASAVRSEMFSRTYEHGVERKDFNSYGSRRGNHEVMVRGTFANVRLRNLLVSGSEGTWTVHVPSGEETTIFEASQRYLADGVPLIVIAGNEYGSGSSRDWAAKGPKLLGVRAVIAESYERIHRSNLLMMGVLPLQFLDGETPESLGLTGREEFSIAGVENGE